MHQDEKNNRVEKTIDKMKKNVIDETFVNTGFRRMRKTKTKNQQEKLQPKILKKAKKNYRKKSQKM
jgi:hypothetical protein